MCIKRLNKISPFPPFYKIATRLWGEEADFDSDGNSETIESTDWSELTLSLRPECVERIDIDLESNYTILKIEASNNILMSKLITVLSDFGVIQK